tara:strand:- start:402 stop:644 length:243 start_codon:yes stop_codon:yes gene_type:complete
MGWEVWRKEYHDGEFVKFGFFCNTSDRGFGPVFSLDCSSVGEFYRIWDEVIGEGFDPRNHSYNEIWDCIVKIKEARGEEI